MAQLDLVEGWTASQDFRVLSSGVAADLTLATVAGILIDGAGSTVNTSGDFALTSTPTDGIVRWSPDLVDMTTTLSPYKLRIKVTIGGLDAFLPQSAPVTVMLWPL